MNFSRVATYLLGIILIFFGIAILFDNLNIFHFNFGGLIIPMILAFIGIKLLDRGKRIAGGIVLGVGAFFFLAAFGLSIGLAIAVVIIYFGYRLIRSKKKEVTVPRTFEEKGTDDRSTSTQYEQGASSEQSAAFHQQGWSAPNRPDRDTSDGRVEEPHRQKHEMTFGERMEEPHRQVHETPFGERMEEPLKQKQETLFDERMEEAPKQKQETLFGERAEEPYRQKHDTASGRVGQPFQHEQQRRDERDKERHQGSYSSQTPKVKHSLIGNLYLTAPRWELTDMNIWHGIGEVKIDLSRAHIHDTETVLIINGWLGDVDIYVPYDLEVAFSAHVNVGDLDIFGNKEGGINRHVSIETAHYRHSSKRVRIVVSLNLGDIDVMYV